MTRALVMANRVSKDTIEAEPIIVNSDDPEIIRLELDDGEWLELDPDELKAALEAAA